MKMIKIVNLTRIFLWKKKLNLNSILVKPLMWQIYTGNTELFVNDWYLYLSKSNSLIKISNIIVSCMVNWIDLCTWNECHSIYLCLIKKRNFENCSLLWKFSCQVVFFTKYVNGKKLYLWSNILWNSRKRKKK